MDIDDQKNEPSGDDQSEQSSDLSWYVLHVYSGCEKRVIELLSQRIAVKKMEKHFGQILVPTEEVVSLRASDKKKVKADRKFFPGYVLIQIDMCEEAWHLVRSVPKVLGFIGGTTERPAPISPREVDVILNRLNTQDDEKPKPKVLFEPGELVRVKEGPFADFNGVVEDVNYEKSRLRVSVIIFGRETPVELEFSQVEKAL